MLHRIRWLAACTALVASATLALGQSAAPTTPAVPTPSTGPSAATGGTTTLSTTTQAAVALPSVPYTTEARPEITGLPPAVMHPRSASDLEAIQERIKAVVKYAMPATVGVLVEDGQGSGVIVSKDGYVLTAGHVSGDPNKPVTIVFSNGARVAAKALGANNGIDSGMVKITAPPPPGGYPFVPLGTVARNIVTNQWVVAMGHPGGYRPGRPPVVRVGRVLKVQVNRQQEPQYIQTDCPLINGDSGGPLFDLDGRLVGINSRIGVDTRANLHVPVDTFTQTWDRLADAQKWGDRRGFLSGRSGPSDRGERGSKPNESASPRLGVKPQDGDKGALVFYVHPGTPAEDLLKVDDIVTRINGKVIRTAEDMVTEIRSRKPGDTITLDLLRKNQPLQVKVTLDAEK
jgi:serine protease Do